MSISYGEIKMKLENGMIGYDEILKEYEKLEKEYDKRSFLKLGVHGDYVTDYESIYDFEMKFKDYEDLMSESLM
tara:strand:- start:153 stop:374 length:222 start_codon:yes stop_codon:yes gene_type:complete